MARSSELITNLDRVRPGDLITAGFFNSLVEAIWELEDRIVTLESEGTTEPSTPSGPAAPGGDGIAVEALKIAFASMEVRGAKVNFEVSGSGLAPAGLATKFTFDDKPFTPAKLEGDGDSITFSTTTAAIQPSSGGLTLGSLLGAQGGGSGDKASGRSSSSNHVLGIKNKKGALAKKRVVVVDDEGGKL